MPVLAGADEISGGIVSAAEAAMRACMLVPFADPASQAQRDGILGASLAWLADREGHLAETSQRVGHAGLIAATAAQCPGPAAGGPWHAESDLAAVR